MVDRSKSDKSALMAEVKYPRRTERRRRTRASILREAAKLFGKDGYGATTMQAIADAADIHVTTLFMHFKTKNDLALSLVTARVDELRDRAVQAQGELAFFDFFRAEALNLADTLEAESRPGVALWNALRNEADLAFAWSEYHHEQQDIYANYVAAEYALDRSDDYRPELVVSLLLTAISLPHRKWVEAGGKIELGTEITRALEIAIPAARQMLK
ncbi:TetR/AcrR family transcriptional regulator [Hyphomonas pacifica]|uniref:Uncharacterized protein n=1 Tax=Hyphomonas pacifica TaxID=1280941 RepID=A0A062TZ83_9PROT|nr:TetR/AcrR family transcriptional regulator [Hyphomonas pacifica]KCZ48022.1 hypothetical protein HY2_16195 [Hyphomonas pacifica]RAN32542.1 hypothetical protein HY3_14955 [Hyphomonas pacifica]